MLWLDIVSDISIYVWTKGNFVKEETTLFVTLMFEKQNIGLCPFCCSKTQTERLVLL